MSGSLPVEVKPVKETNMALPEFNLRQLLEAGAHFGHNTHRWNPKMQRYIFGKRNNVHIIDLSQSVPLLHQALKVVSDTVAGGGRVLFVGTKRQASDLIAESAKKSAQYYVNHRWLGGTLTNWATISNSIKRLGTLKEMLEGPAAERLTKKERLMLAREHDKLELALGGIKDMGGTPDLMFVVDTNKEANAVQEARRLNIPVVGILDTNCDPDAVDHPIPGNDDATRAIALYCDLIAKAALDGIARQQSGSGVDVGAQAQAPAEEALTEPVVTEEPAPVAELAAEAGTEPVGEAEAPAAEAAADEGPLYETPEGEPDDLKLISGVGPVLEGKLHELGITKFAQIAGFSKEDIDRVDDRLNFKGRIERDDWIKQATDLAKA